jgi:hypothetical protein
VAASETRRLEPSESLTGSPKRSNVTYCCSATRLLEVYSTPPTHPAPKALWRCAVLVKQIARVSTGWGLMDIQLHTTDRIPMGAYIEKSREERKSHIDLSDPCLEVGCDSQESRALMCLVLNVSAPKAIKVHLCHACNNPACSNPKHLYWGTPSDNSRDAHEANPDMSKRGAKTRMANDPDVFKKLGKAGGLIGGPLSAMPEEEVAERLYLVRHHNPHKWGFNKLAGEIWGITPQVASRFYKKYGPANENV